MSFSTPIYIAMLFSLCSSLFAEELLCPNPEEYALQDKTQRSVYKNCKRNGLTVWLEDDGSIKSKVNFIDDKEEGPYISYYTNGKKRLVVNYKHGQKEGMQKIYYDNGQLGSQVMYKNGRREGLMTEWDKTGYKSSEVFYKNNYKVGVKKFFNSKGEVIRTVTYEMDRNPVMVKMLKEKRKEILIDLSKYGLVPKDAPEEKRFK